MEYGDKLMSLSYHSLPGNQWKETELKWPVLPADRHLATHRVAGEEGGRNANADVKSELPQHFLFCRGKEKEGERSGGNKDV